MTDVINISCSGVLRVGEHQSDSLIVEGLEREEGKEYLLSLLSTDGHSYTMPLPEGDEALVPASVLSCAGELKAMVSEKCGDGSYIAKSRLFSFAVKHSLNESAETPPPYEAAQSLANRAIEAAKEAEKALEEAQLLIDGLGELGNQGNQSSGLRHIFTINPETGISFMHLSTDMEGNPFALKRLLIKISGKKAFKPVTTVDTQGTMYLEGAFMGNFNGLAPGIVVGNGMLYESMIVPICQLTGYENIGQLMECVITAELTPDGRISISRRGHEAFIRTNGYLSPQFFPYSNSGIAYAQTITDGQFEEINAFSIMAQNNSINQYVTIEVYGEDI
ncbi:MAG: hypothetical protein LBS74_09445 [Oscillospiraceae bacterium]|nr:hypothetical protein [Oscillospiraceae bacterium]